MVSVEYIDVNWYVYNNYLVEFSSFSLFFSVVERRGRALVLLLLSGDEIFSLLEPALVALSTLVNGITIVGLFARLLEDSVFEPPDFFVSGV